MVAEALRRIVAGSSGHEVAWIAAHGAEAVELAAKDRPDLILMDLIMPVMDGVEATRRIMAESPCAILVVTATIEGNLSQVFKAMGAGALDAVTTPAGPEGARDLLAKIDTISRLVGRPKPTGLRPASARRRRLAETGALPLVVIGSSTGGPKALADVFASLRPTPEAAIVVVQHVDAQFAAGLAAWLDDVSPIRVRVAARGAKPEAGMVLLAGTNDHLVLTPELVLDYTPHPLQNPYRPSVDVFFHSVAESWPSPGVGILLTGMGRDGAQGMLHLRNAGWHTIAQDRATSVIYGMPKAAADLGAAVEVLPDAKIGDAMMAALGRRRNATPPRGLAVQAAEERGKR
jgi:two-component system response regulator WspF